MFSFFKKNAASPTRDEISNEQLRTPSPSIIGQVGSGSKESPIHNHVNETGPPDTPSPPAHGQMETDLGLITDPAALYELISSVPAKTLHEYTLNHLIPSKVNNKRKAPAIPSSPPPAITLTHLTSFFSALTPPPLLHCMRCHKSYYDVENTDRSCLVAHDDESAEVERVGVGRGDSGTQYETLWGCCGKTVEGDGDMGPPDGWCYEGYHTTDTKRARFRADSTLHDDKLTTCTRLRCYDPKPEKADSDGSSDEEEAKPKKKVPRKRTRRAEDDGEEERESTTVLNDDAVSVGSSKGKAKAPPKPRKKRAKTTEDEKMFKPGPEETDEDEMEVDESASIRKKPRASAARKKKTALNSEQGATSTTVPGSPPRNPPGSPACSVKGSGSKKQQNVSFAAGSESEKKKKVKPRSSVGGGKKTKKLEEVVASSVDGEM